MAKFQLSRLEAGFIAAAARGGDVKVKRDMQEEQSRKGVGVGDGKEWNHGEQRRRRQFILFNI